MQHLHVVILKAKTKQKKCIIFKLMLGRVVELKPKNNNNNKRKEKYNHRAGRAH